MIVFNPLTGRCDVRMSRDEFMGYYRRWQQKPETRAMFEKIAADRRARIDKILADIRKTCQKSRGE
ncbi:hypothetical protein HDR63_03085 [bacterium]|nr:hypothetical protein [bacterium]